MAPRNEARPPLAPRLFSRLSHASKHSFLSHSSSFEADDEHSSTTTGVFDSGTMSPSTDDGEDGGGDRLPPPKYAAEDTRPTSSKELAGWYAYAFAAEVYVICGQ